MPDLRALVRVLVTEHRHAAGCEHFQRGTLRRQAIGARAGLGRENNSVLAVLPHVQLYGRTWSRSEGFVQRPVCVLVVVAPFKGTLLPLYDELIPLELHAGLVGAGNQTRRRFCC